MEAIKEVINICVELLNTRLTFSPYTFSIGQVLLGISALSIVISFVVHLFDSR